MMIPKLDLNAVPAKWKYSGHGLASIIKAQRIVSHTYESASKPAQGDQVPTLDPATANWLGIHGFSYSPMKLNNRGAVIWFWRVTRNNDTKRPRTQLDLTLTQANPRDCEIRCSRMWPEHI